MRYDQEKIKICTELQATIPGKLRDCTETVFQYDACLMRGPFNNFTINSTKRGSLLSCMKDAGLSRSVRKHLKWSTLCVVSESAVNLARGYCPKPLIFPIIQCSEYCKMKECMPTMRKEFRAWNHRIPDTCQFYHVVSATDC